MASIPILAGKVRRNDETTTRTALGYLESGILARIRSDVTLCMLAGLSKEVVCISRNKQTKLSTRLDRQRVQER
jgi:hypothetical protein